MVLLRVHCMCVGVHVSVPCRPPRRASVAHHRRVAARPQWAGSCGCVVCSRCWHRVRSGLAFVAHRSKPISNSTTNTANKSGTLPAGGACVARHMRLYLLVALPSFLFQYDSLFCLCTHPHAQHARHLGYAKSSCKRPSSFSVTRSCFRNACHASVAASSPASTTAHTNIHAELVTCGSKPGQRKAAMPCAHVQPGGNAAACEAVNSSRALRPDWLSRIEIILPSAPSSVTVVSSDKPLTCRAFVQRA